MFIYIYLSAFVILHSYVTHVYACFLWIDLATSVYSLVESPAQSWSAQTEGDTIFKPYSCEEWKIKCGKLDMYTWKSPRKYEKFGVLRAPLLSVCG